MERTHRESARTDLSGWHTLRMDSVAAFLDEVEQRRSATSDRLAPRARAARGQFFTPRATAGLLASMLSQRTGGWRLIDPGAGVGSLTAALVARWLLHTDSPEMSVLAYEIDPDLAEPLEATLVAASKLATSFGRALHTTVRIDDFVLKPPPAGVGNVVLMNPPYKKLNVGSAEQVALAQGPESVRITNFYAAFLVRAVRALELGGDLVAITPRSFANGPYFRELRLELLKRASFRRLHLFEARDRVFADTEVLQENLIFSMRTGALPGDVEITTSCDAEGEVSTLACRHDQVVHPNDRHHFIRLPSNDQALAVAERMAAMPSTLSELGLAVSTGRVVDFRARESLRAGAGVDTVPLVYPQNLKAGVVRWPVATKKPQALLRVAATGSLLLPNEHYVVVKRFSAKEEPRRVVAAVADPGAFDGAEAVAYENHLNVFHMANRGLEPKVAAGLSAYLNSRLVDAYVRQFNGHTQINATDLRELRYPRLDQLRALGSAVIELGGMNDEDTLDSLLADVLETAEAFAAVA